MAGTEKAKNWMFTPSQDYSVGGILTLGQILEDRHQPGSALITGKQVPFDEDRRQDRGWKKDVNSAQFSLLTKSFNAYCEANGLPLKANADGGVTTEATTNLHIEELDSEGFLPSVSYIEAALKSGDVATKTQWWKLRRRLYMVTGLRIARGSSINREQKHSTDLNAGLAADASALEVPASGAVGGQRQHTQGLAESAAAVSDFIYAYRLEEITYRLWVSHKPISYGQTESTEGESQQRAPKSDEVPDGYEFTGLDSDPFEGDDDPMLTY